MKTKIESYGNKAIDFHDREIPKVISNINWFFSEKRGKLLYAKVNKLKKVIAPITNHLEVPSDNLHEPDEE